MDKSLTHYICIDCRFHVRHPKGAEVRLCNFCKEPMSNMGRKFKVPKKHNKSQWKKLKVWFSTPCVMPLYNIDSYSETKQLNKKLIANSIGVPYYRQLLNKNNRCVCETI